MKPQHAVVFLGPTITLAQAETRWPDADYRPPAERGDVLRAVDDGAGFIGIVDGFFEAVPSVWHKEVLHALEQRVHVAGSSSMGALRAAELAPFGMHGIGRVFEMVDSGEIDDDDVALVHAPAEFGHRPFSLPLVNIRCSLDRAIADAIVDDSFGSALVAAQKRRFYPDRTMQTLADDARSVDAIMGARFIDWYESAAVDQKAMDAHLLLDHGRRWQRGEIPSRRRPRLERTASFEAMVAEERRGREPHGEISGGARDEVMVEARQRATARAAARRRGFEPDQRNIDDAADRLRRRFGLDDPAALEVWLRARGLTSADYRAMLEREAIVYAGGSAAMRSETPPAAAAAASWADVDDVMTLQGFG